jgi:hypothetical protein
MNYQVKTQEQWEREYEKLMKSYKSSSMNNTKWIKLLIAISESTAKIELIEWQCIGDGLHFSGPPLTADKLHPERLPDGVYQPIEYKWIEWNIYSKRN